MCRKATARFLVAIAFAATLDAQIAIDWRRIGNTVVAAGLASPAGGPVNRVWYSSDGRILYARTASGNTFRTEDGEHWTPLSVDPPTEVARTASPVLARGFAYRVDNHVWRSTDGGEHWSNVTKSGSRSILGGWLNEVAVSPINPDEIVVAGEQGVWKSVDGGSSWIGLNEGLPNLPAARLLSVVPGEVRISTIRGDEILWVQGGDKVWIPAGGSFLASERALLDRTGARSAVRAGDTVYAGFSDGRIAVSTDRGRTFVDTPRVNGAGSVERLFADARDPAFALALTQSSGAARVLRTVNRGTFWDDITADLPPGAVYGIAADRVTGAVYIAGEAGVFLTYTDTRAAAQPTPWVRIREERARDVLLDAAGNQIYVALEGAGVFAALAPHRTKEPRVVSAGDRTARPAAPGSLLSVLGTKVDSALAGDRPASVLAASDTESQVQLPWDLKGTGVIVSMTSAAGGQIQIGLPVAETAPSIFVDKDGGALLMDADSGLMLEAGSPAHSRTRIQILASGLGRVTPDLPLGTAAPLRDPPRVVAPVQVFLDREQIEVVRATLAPGYVGLYIVEAQLPAIVNRGPAELFIQAGGTPSNRVRLWLEP